MTIVNGVWNWMVNLSPTGKIATSLIAKDVIGCVMYTSTARRNKQYTPEKRADVANYDLMNGVINIALQLLAIKPIETGLTKLFDSHLMKYMFKNLDERLADKKNYKKTMDLIKEKSGLVKGSVALVSVVLCQYVIKRFIAPYLSMPAAEKSQEIGIIKPKLYPGETYNKERNFGIKDKIEDIKEFNQGVRNDIQNFRKTYNA